MEPKGKRSWRKNDREWIELGLQWSLPAILHFHCTSIMIKFTIRAASGFWNSPARVTAMSCGLTPFEWSPYNPLSAFDREKKIVKNQNLELFPMHPLPIFLIISFRRHKIHFNLLHIFMLHWETFLVLIHCFPHVSSPYLSTSRKVSLLEQQCHAWYTDTLLSTGSLCPFLRM